VGGQYVWRWDTELWPAGAGRPGTRLRQSTFQGAPLSPDRLRRRSADFAPGLGEEGRADAFILGRMDGQKTLADIAREAAEQFPRLFPDPPAALARCGELALRYSR
jgi:hypothetical protein